jgi:putative transposase
MDAMAVLREAWTKAGVWQVGRWMLMPDHIHLFCAPTCVPAESLGRWVGYWKSEAATHWPRGDECPLWQRDFWDTQVRRSDSYRAKWDYVRQNPVSKGLVVRAEEWPFQGEETQLWWR